MMKRNIHFNLSSITKSLAPINIIVISQQTHFDPKLVLQSVFCNRHIVEFMTGGNQQSWSNVFETLVSIRRFVQDSTFQEFDFQMVQQN